MDPETVQRYNALKNISKQYFEQPQEIKNNNADVDRNNLGYVVVPGVREYLKVNPTTNILPTYINRYYSFVRMISKLIGPINSPSSEAFSTHFLNGATTLPGPALTALRKRSRVDYVQVLKGHNRHHEEKDTRLIPDETVAAIQEFVPVKSSVSVIHYLAQEDDKCACEEHTGTSLSRICCASHW
jgi:hypothetical protein